MDILNNSRNRNLSMFNSIQLSSNVPSFLDPDLIQQTLLQKCQAHPQETCDFIYLNARAITQRICYSCIQEKEIPAAEVLPIKQILQANSESILLTYPVFKDTQMNKKFKALIGQVDSIVDQVDEFFQKLRQAAESAIDKLQRTQKLKLIKYTETYQKMMDSFKDIAKIEELQKLIVQSPSDNEDILKFFIKTHCENKQANEDAINIYYRKFKDMDDTFSLEKAEESISQIEDILKTINIFSNKEGNKQKENTNINDLEQFKSLAVSTLSQQTNLSQSLTSSQHSNAEGISLISTLNILPSEYLYSSKDHTTILRNPNNQQNDSSIIITNNNHDDQNIQCYINHELDPSKKYIIRVELNNAKNYPYFIFGLLEDKKKNNEFLALSKLSYCEVTGYGMSRIIKGNQVHSGQRNIGLGQQREFRIHLARQFFRIASYPDYLNVAELKDPKLIKENEKYYFAICIHGDTNSVLVKDVLCVENFDDKME